jgi:hypothetical protein
LVCPPGTYPCLFCDSWPGKSRAIYYKRKKRKSDPIESIRKVGDKIGRALKADREPEDPVTGKAPVGLFLCPGRITEFIVGKRKNSSKGFLLPMGAFPSQRLIRDMDSGRRHPLADQVGHLELFLRPQLCPDILQNT